MWFFLPLKTSGTMSKSIFEIALAISKPYFTKYFLSWWMNFEDLNHELCRKSPPHPDSNLGHFRTYLSAQNQRSWTCPTIILRNSFFRSCINRRDAWKYNKDFRNTFALLCLLFVFISSLKFEKKMQVIKYLSKMTLFDTV